jgi:hypothetical protein
MSVIQCDKLVPNQLACPCPTFVNHNNQVALQGLDNLQFQWTKQGCGKDIMCPAIACVVPSSAACVAGSPGSPGKCTGVAFN